MYKYQYNDAHTLYIVKHDINWGTQDAWSSAPQLIPHALSIIDHSLPGVCKDYIMYTEMSVYGPNQF